MPGPVHRRRLVGLVVAMALSVLGSAACEPHTVSFRFAPQVGDEFRFRSEVRSLVTRTVDGVPTEVASDAVLTATETVVDADDDGIRVAVVVARDATTPRRFEVTLDRASRLRAIDLIEGVPVEALGLDLGTDLPSEVASPPEGPLEPGRRWTIDTTVVLDGVDAPVRVTGGGRITTLGVEDGHDVAVAEVTVTVPVRGVVDTSDGRVTLAGSQTARSTSAYDLDDGAVRRDRTTVVGRVDLVVEPPTGIAAAPVRGALSYRIETHTTRLDP